MSTPTGEVSAERMETQDTAPSETEVGTEAIDWTRVVQLRVSRTILEALSNLEISAVYLVPANRRKDARKKYLGHGTRRMMVEAQTLFGLDKPNRFVEMLCKNPAGIEKYREDALQVVDEAIESKDVVSREGHSGLIQLTMAIRVKDRVAGVFRCGDFFAGKPDDLMVAKVSERLAYLGVPPAALAEEIRKAKFFSSEKVAVIQNLLEMLALEIASYVEETTGDVATTADVTKYTHQGLITKNPIILDVIRQIKLIGTSDSSVIIYGESGTGKELISKLIHENSNRAQKPLVTINCAALTETILEAELFGYRKGAFTGAVGDKKGLFEVADTGTVFLDEVGEMSLSLQVKILRLIQEGTFMRVGDTEMRQVDVRIVSATHRDLRRLIELGKFREDLYYRLAVVELTLPPLRDRPEDIPILVHHFLEEFQGKTSKQGIALSGEVMKIFQEHYWPGNVRELRNEIERIVALRSGNSLVKPEDLSKHFFYETYPEGIRAGDEDEEGFIKRMTDEFEKSMLSKYLRKHKWNKTKVARLCGITRQGLNKKISKYKLDRRRF